MIKEYIIKIDEDQSKKDIHGGYPLIESPLELVRCKDCTFRNEINCPQYYRRKELPDDWFCAHGKREERGLKWDD